MSIEEILRSNSLFRDLDEAAIAMVARGARRFEAAAGTVVTEEGKRERELYLVHEGELGVTMKGAKIATLRAGDSFGAAQAILGGARNMTVTAASASVLVAVTPKDLEDASMVAPELAARLTTLARQRLQRKLLALSLPHVFGAIDPEMIAEIEARTTWVRLTAGQALFQQGDPGDAWYLVVSGRLQVVARGADGAERVIGEVGRGEGLGEVALLAGTPRMGTPYALRDTELIRFSREHFDEILTRHPQALLSISRLLIRRTLGADQGKEVRTPSMNIAVIPLVGFEETAAFTRALVEALSPFGRALHIGTSRVAETSVMGVTLHHPDGHPSWIRFGAWLDERADAHRFIVFECDPEPTSWTRRALREADLVILLADRETAPEPGAFERELFPAGVVTARHTRRVLVLQHPAGAPLPVGTGRWFPGRDLSGHHHVRADRPGDMQRLARIIAGKAVTLVLGAGGARGFAHVGVIKALEERFIPIDHVGGTSAGAIIAAMLAMGMSSAEMSTINVGLQEYEPFTEYTLPITSLVAGRRFEKGLRAVFGDGKIEDLWVPFFACSCDISAFREVALERGPIVQALMASSALPGVMPPVLIDGHLHVDGGSTKALPGDEMRARTRGALIAVDVSTERELYIEEERYPLSWSALWRRLRRADEPPLPSIVELFMRAVSLRTANRTEEVAADADLFLRPPVEHYGTIAFEGMAAIEQIGYEHAREKLATWEVPR